MSTGPMNRLAQPSDNLNGGHECPPLYVGSLLCLAIKEDGQRGETESTPGYVMAKNVIKCINNVAGVISADPAMEGRLQVVFFPDYNVTAMETICPATDLSVQISTAGKEASGTGNMKFMMNGALDAVVHSVQNPSDPWMTAADFRSFVDTQTEASKVFRDVERWTRMSILNTAASGRFSTDRTIRDYNEDIWNLEPIQPV